jgi:hypothetical protein
LTSGRALENRGRLDPPASTALTVVTLVVVSAAGFALVFLALEADFLLAIFPSFNVKY